jgi:hypothetical protein
MVNSCAQLPQYPVAPSGPRFFPTVSPPQGGESVTKTATARPFTVAASRNVSWLRLPVL